MRDTKPIENTVRLVGDKFAHIFKDVGTGAWEELKTGIDKAWDEIRLGVDDGIQTASEAFGKAWIEIAGSVDRAKATLLKEDPSRQTSRRKKTKGSRSRRDPSMEKETSN